MSSIRESRLTSACDPHFAAFISQRTRERWRGAAAAEAAEMAAWETMLVRAGGIIRCLNCPLFKTRISHSAQGSSIEAGHSHSLVGAACTEAYHAYDVRRGAAAACATPHLCEASRDDRVERVEVTRTRSQDLSILVEISCFFVPVSFLSKKWRKVSKWHFSVTTLHGIRRGRPSNRPFPTLTREGAEHENRVWKK